MPVANVGNTVEIEAGSKAAWKDEKDEVRAADMKDAVLPEENIAPHKIF